MEDTFKFVMPAELTKGEDGEWKISGLASTGSVDRQGEIIVPAGIDATPIASGKGFFNFDHDNSPESTIGLLDGYRKSDKGMFVSGRLFKNHKKAQAVYEIMSSLGKSDKGRVGMSVEGKVLERDPFNKNIIKRCVVKNVAVTMNPVNQDTYADIIKSFNGSEVEFDSTGKSSDSSVEPPTFTATQVLQIVEKALGIGAGNSAAPAGRTGGDALSVSNMGEKPRKKKLKRMSKEMYKSQMNEMMNKLQQLYPENSRQEIWEAVKDRMETTFEILDKGGPGSGKPGHTTLRDRSSDRLKARQYESQDNPEPAKHSRPATTPQKSPQHRFNETVDRLKTKGEWPDDSKELDKAKAASHKYDSNPAIVGRSSAVSNS